MRRVLVHVRPLRDRARDVSGRCVVCGRQARFLFNSWVLPVDLKAALGDDSWVDSFARRESMNCSNCYASLRVRRIAEVLLLHYGRAALSMEELVKEDDFRGLIIAEINAVGALHEILSGHPQLRYSEYRRSGPTSGEAISSEDIRSLSYPDASVDLILTSDTLEHVPEYARALAETRRVLRAGGRHVFTVPLFPFRDETVVRAQVGPGGMITYCAPPQYHGRGSRPILRLIAPRRPDYLCYTEFGMDILEMLAAAGFEAETHPAPGELSEDDAAIIVCARAV
jgi:hypothetical protein